MVAACIAALVGTWSVVIRVFMHRCAVGVSVTPSMCSIRPSILATSPPVGNVVSCDSGVHASLRSGCVRHPVHVPYSTQYSSHESAGCIYYVYDILTMVAACIAALVGTWSVVIRVFMHRCAVGVSVNPSMCTIRPSILATSLPVVSIMYMTYSQWLLHVSLLWLARGQL